MTTVLVILYWISLLVVLYTYLGYGMVIGSLASAKNKRVLPPLPDTGLPDITIIIPAYNEAAILGPKIRNTLGLHYPTEKMQVIVITDGSTDGNDAIARAFPQVLPLPQEERRGKAAAINRAMRQVNSSITVITDANAFVNAGALRHLAVHYSDPATGGVSGEKRVAGEEGSAPGEGLYWKYESWLKQQDAAAGTVVGAAGELLSFRTALFTPLEEDTILDDFMLSMRICLAGYRIAYEPAATASESGSVSMAEEQKRKLRIAAGGYQAMSRLSELWRMNRHPLLSFQYFSHRVLRWTLTPFCLGLLLLVNFWLVVREAGDWYRFSFWMQVVFYGAALAGWLGSRLNRNWPVVTAIYYFVFMNISALKGGWLYCSGRHSVLWQKSERLPLPVNVDKSE